MHSSVPVPSFGKLAARWHTLNDRFEAAMRTTALRDKEYRGTPDGLAESQRQLDVCCDPEYRTVLQRAHQAGQVVAAQEFRARAAKGTVDDRDGYLFSLPLGEKSPLATLLVRERVMATGRAHPDRTADLPVTLLRIDATGARRRCTVRHPKPGPGALTLEQVVRGTHALGPAGVRKLRTVFGESYGALADLLDSSDQAR
ncbi:hypothetical protein ACWIGI_34670 [Nocardia sp. NPDC055321]